MTKTTASGFLSLLCMILPLASCAQDTNGSDEPWAQGGETSAGDDFVADWHSNLFCEGRIQHLAISKTDLASLSDYEDRSIIERSGYDAELVKWILFREDRHFVIATPRSHLGPEPDFNSNEMDAWSKSWSECGTKTSRIYALPGNEYVEVPFSPHCGMVGVEPSEINVTIYEVKERTYIEFAWPSPAAGLFSLYQAGSEGVLKVGLTTC